MKLRLLGDTLHVRVLAPAERAPGSLILLPTTRKPGEATAVPALVLSVGPGAVASSRLFPERPAHPVDTSPRVYHGDVLPMPDVAEGDFVLLDTRFAGQHLTADRERIVHAEEVIAHLEGYTEADARALL